MFLAPGIIKCEDSIGFLLILIGIVLSVIMIVLWAVFCILKQKSNKKLKIVIASLSIIGLLLLVNIFAADFIHLGNSSAVVLAMLWLIPIISNVLFIVFSK